MPTSLPFRLGMLTPVSFVTCAGAGGALLEQIVHQMRPPQRQAKTAAPRKRGPCNAQCLTEQGREAAGARRQARLAPGTAT